MQTILVMISHIATTEEITIDSTEQEFHVPSVGEYFKYNSRRYQITHVAYELYQIGDDGKFEQTCTVTMIEI